MGQWQCAPQDSVVESAPLGAGGAFIWLTGVGKTREGYNGPTRSLRK